MNRPRGGAIMEQTEALCFAKCRSMLDFALC